MEPAASPLLVRVKLTTPPSLTLAAEAVRKAWPVSEVSLMVMEAVWAARLRLRV